MFEPLDEKNLIKDISEGRVILFLGAGFSSEAKNQFDENLPIGSQFAEKIWNFLNYTTTYKSENLTMMAQALASSGKPHSEIIQFYSDHLIARSIPPEYEEITKPFWYKLYTTNVDNLITEVYKKNRSSKLKVLSYPSDEPSDRDQFLEKIQLVHLNGQLLKSDGKLAKPNELIFSTMEYAKSSNVHLPLYEQFVRECAIHPTIYIGTSLSEPLFWEYIAARQERSARTKEYRDRSYVISQSISEAHRKFLKDHYNINCIEAGIIEFLKWLKEISSQLMTRSEVLKHTIPNIVEYFTAIGYSQNQKEIHEFAGGFKYISIPTKLPSYRSLYLLGASPNWEDIFLNFDAPRNITSEIHKSIEETLTTSNELNILALIGTPGCGKSTILKRLGYLLIQSGKKIYYSNSESIPSPSTIFNFLKIINERVILMFENSEIILNILPNIVKELEKLTKPPIILISSRTYEFKNLTSRYKSILSLKEYHIPLKLDKTEITNIIDKLIEKNVPGKLRGMTRLQQIHEFEIRADKQILVAMKEATSGMGFNKIIEKEFLSIDPQEAKILSLCVALTSDAGYSIALETFIGFSKVSSGDALHLLNNQLQDIILKNESENNLLSFRHRAIAKDIIDIHAPRDFVKEAYIRVLDSLSILVTQRASRDKISGLYRSIINHKTIYHRFSKKIDAVREIYDSVKDELANEFHFWLQYACLEIEANGGDLIIAENYLEQAESLKANHSLSITARGHLFLKKSVKATSKTQSIEFREKGEDILLKMIESRGYEDPYCYHIYCYQLYNWIHIWAIDDSEKSIELERLIAICKRGFSFHPKNGKLEDILEKLQRAIFNLGVDKNQRPEDPILNFD